MTEAPPSPANLATPAPVIPVSLLNRMARERLESAFPLCWVAGEISNLTYAASGHVYFTLKDAQAQVRCVMYRNRAQLLGWRLANGQRIEARVLVTLYEARGDFQLNVENARQAGITSPQAAALRDVLTTLRRRAPQVGVVLYPTPVQGAGAAREIVAALRVAGERKECDLLILCRGGGSLEDLWEFNDEALARDTLLDTLAAQRRQLQRQWQSALQGRQQALDLLALRLVHPAEQIARQRRQLDHLAHRLGGALAQTCTRRRQALGALGQRLTVARPQTERAARRLDALAHRLDAAGHLALDERRANLARFAAALAHLNPQAVLERGYSLVTDEHGVIVRDSRTLEPNARIAVCFRHGRAEATVVATQDE